MSLSPALSAASLLEHESFIRAVVRGSLQEESEVQDVVQETWLRAIKRGPVQDTSIRPWLARVATNLVRDSFRRSKRRQAREERAAKAESIESVASTYERLSTQREVAGCVLGLQEPYKQVVILHYYHGLNAAQIGKQLERSAGTVRSQLKRAHEILRTRLDQDVDGGRRTWACLAFPVGALPQAAGGSLAKTWTWTGGQAAGVGACVVAVVAVVATFVLREVEGPGLEPRGGGVELSAVTPLRKIAQIEGQGVAAEVGSKTQRQAVALTAPDDEGQDASQPEPLEVSFEPQRVGWLAEQSADRLLDLSVQTQRAIRAWFLTPDERLVASHARLLAMPQTGISRILTGNGSTSNFQELTGVQGGAQDFSFETLSHDYNDSPDLSFSQGAFSSRFGGISLGLLGVIGDVRLEDLPKEAEEIERWVPLTLREKLSPVWGEISMDEAAHESAFRKANQELRRSMKPQGVGQTFLVRSFRPDECDSLIAVRPLSIDPESCTFAWRVLKTWPVPGEDKGRFRRAFDESEIPDGPVELGGMRIGALIDLLSRIRGVASERLLSVPDAVREEYASLVAVRSFEDIGQAGFARILERGKWDALIGARGGGAYYSFFSRSNSYDENPELELSGIRRFSSGFAGSKRGLLLDLGELPADQFAAIMTGKDSIQPEKREAWDFLWDVSASFVDREYGKLRVLSEADEKRAVELGMTRGAIPATVGHTYVLRSVAFDSHDHLVVFKVVAADESGQTLVWRILRTWPVLQAPAER